MFKKKIYLWLLIAAVFIGAFFLYFFARPPLAISAILPADAMAYARLEHADKHFKNISASSFAKEVLAIDIPKVMAKNGFPEDKINQIKQWQSKPAVVLDNFMLKEILGREVGIAFYPDPVLVVRLNPSVFAAELLGQMSKTWGNNAEMRQSSYKGFTVQHVLLKDKKVTIVYVRLRDLLVVALEPSKQLERVIDVYHSGSKPLSNDEHFTSLVKRSYTSGEGFVYINAAWLAKEFKAQDIPWLDSSGMYAYGLSFLPGEFNRIKIIAGVDSKTTTQAQRKILSCPAGNNDSLPFIPVNAIGYDWGNCYDLNDNLKLFEGIQQFKNKVEKRLKIDFEKEVLPALGKEMGGYLTDIDTRGVFPFPRILFFMKVKDRVVINEVLRKATANPLVMVQHEKYGKADIHYMQLPLGANMDPGYCMLGDYLLVATSRQLLKKSLDASAQLGPSLAQEKVFKQFGLGGDDKNNALMFLKVGDLAVRAIALAEWADKYLAAQVSTALAYEQEAQEQADELIQELKDNNDELKVAMAKLQGLGVKPEADLENIQRGIDRLRDDISVGQTQIAEIKQGLINDEAQVRSTKLVIFNIDNVLMPLLRGATAFKAQGVRVNLGEHFWETELFLK